jgi:hypothetical protein
MMEDINNIPFSFDRNVSKWIAKLGTSHADNSFADGITLTNTVINNYFLGETTQVVDNYFYNFTYKTKSGEMKTVSREVPEGRKNGLIGVLGIANRILPDDSLFYTINYELERDPWGNYKNFKIEKIEDINLNGEGFSDAMYRTSAVSHDNNGSD